MKAAVMRRHGGPDVLVYEDLPTPDVAPGDVLIRMEAIGVNRFDMLVRSGNVPNASVKMPHVPGVEGSGVVAAVGDGVTAFRVGDRVVPILTISLGTCDKPVCYCAQGHDNVCAKFDKIGHTRWGTYAEYIRVNQFSLLHLPDLKVRAADFDPLIRERMLAGALAPAHWLWQAHRVRRYVRDRALRVFDRCDVVIAPCTPMSAPVIGTEWITLEGERMLARPNLGLFTQPISFLGWPVAAVPVVRPALLVDPLDSSSLGCSCCIRVRGLRPVLATRSGA